MNNMMRMQGSNIFTHIGASFDVKKVVKHKNIPINMEGLGGGLCPPPIPPEASDNLETQFLIIFILHIPNQEIKKEKPSPLPHPQKIK